MKNYTVVFYNEGKKICWKNETARNEDDAKLGAEFWIKTQIGSVEYDQVEAFEK